MKIGSPTASRTIAWKRHAPGSHPTGGRGYRWTQDIKDESEVSAVWLVEVEEIKEMDDVFVPLSLRMRSSWSSSPDFSATTLRDTLQCALL